MKDQQTNRIPLFIVLFLTLLVSVIYIIVALQQENSVQAPPASAIATEDEAYMQNIREHRDMYALTSVPFDKKLTFTLHIAPDSADVGKVLYEDDYGTISLSDVRTDEYQWTVYFDFIGKGDTETFSLLSLDADENYPLNTGNAIEAPASSGGIAAVEALTKEETSDDWRVKISYPCAGSTSWHQEYWNSEDLLPNGERIGYNIFSNSAEMDAAEKAGGLDVTFIMKGLKLLTWQAKDVG